MQLFHRCGIVSTASDPGIDEEECRAVEFLGNVFYFNEENGANVLSNLRSLNRLERLDLPAQLSCAYVQVGVIVSVIGSRALADHYLLLARESLPSDANAVERILFDAYSALIFLPRAQWRESAIALDAMYGPVSQHW